MSLEKGYYVGLDVGSGTCGWAVVEDTKDSDGKCLFKLARLKGKDAWGAYIFEEGEDCKKRRGFRSARRRNDRRKYRIYQLQKLFAIPISKKDPTFFKRLNQSAYFNDDKSDEIKNTYPLFKNKKDEKEFYKKYPTIFHLREKLVEGDKEAFCDIRNVYLALHHIIKYRGNFLTDEKFSSNSTIDYEKEFDELNQIIRSYYADNTELCNKDVLKKEDYSKAYSIIVSDKTKNDKERELKSLINQDFVDNDCQTEFYMFASLVSGRKFNFEKELGIVDAEKKDFSFDSLKDEDKDNVRDYFGDKADLFDKAYIFFCDAKIKKLIHYSKEGCVSPLSTSMKMLYEIHKVDLKYVKKMLKEIDSKENGKNYYDDFFVNENLKDNYPAYIHSSAAVKEKKASTSDGINKNIKNILKTNIEHIDDSTIDEYLKERKELISELEYDKNSIKSSFVSLLDNEKTELFPLISIYSTSVIPHQLHEIELDAILENCKRFYPELYVKTSQDELDFAKKIKTIFLFKIPYYYGPINNDLKNENQYSNIERKDEYKDKKITMFNIKDVVDEGKTKENFIKKLINNCKYLDAEKVISKSSLLYQEYMIRDRLNALQVNGEYLKGEEREELFNFIYRRSKTTVEDIKKELKDRLKMDESSINISGINASNPFVSSSYYCAYKLYNQPIENDSSLYKKVEEIIELCTIYSDDKSELKKVLLNDKHLTQEEMKEFLKLKTDSWSPFSKKLLNGIKSEGEEKTIIEYMRDPLQHLNFQQVYFKYHFDKIVERINSEHSSEDPLNKKIEEIIDRVPPKFRKSINSSLKILDDIVKANDGVAPKTIYLEVTREDKAEKKNKESVSRVDKIKKLYSDEDSRKGILSMISEEELKELSDLLDDKDISTKIKGEQVYLYFMQLGRDLYDHNTRIDFDELIKGNSYDVDHIVPKSLTPIPDDSLDNKALVSSKINQKVKQDIYPLTLINNGQIIESNKSFWKMLYDKKLMSKKKYDALTRRSEMTDDELCSFMNAQLNVVSYTNTVLKRVFKLKYPESEIDFVKAQFASEIRHFYGIQKLRIQSKHTSFGNTQLHSEIKPFAINLNDAHHAFDAYLNIVCGKTLFERFNSDDRIKGYIKEKRAELRNKNNKDDSEEDKAKRSLNMMNYLIYSIPYSTRINIIKTCLTKHSPLVVYGLMNVGQSLYDQTLNSPKNVKEDSLIPVHTKEGPYNDVSKYGGYTGKSIHSFLLYSYDEKKKKGICRLVPIHVSVYKKYEHIDDKEERYRLISEELISSDENKLKEVTNLQLLAHIPLGIKIKYGDNVFQLRSLNKIQYVLKNAYQNYLDEEVSFDDLDGLDEKDKFLKMQERTKYSTSRYVYFAVKKFKYLTEDKVNNEEITLVTSKKGNTYTFSKWRNIRIFGNLMKTINSFRFNGVRYIERIRKVNEDGEFFSFSMQDQILTICCLINLLYKESSKESVQYLQDAPSTPYLQPGFTVSESFTTISESPTGLFRKEKTYFIKKEKFLKI